MSGNTDPLLIDISNAFYTGNYQQCISLAEKIKVNKYFVVASRFHLTRKYFETF